MREHIYVGKVVVDRNSANCGAVCYHIRPSFRKGATSGKMPQRASLAKALRHIRNGHKSISSRITARGINHNRIACQACHGDAITTSIMEQGLCIEPSYRLEHVASITINSWKDRG